MIGTAFVRASTHLFVSAPPVDGRSGMRRPIHRPASPWRPSVGRHWGMRHPSGAFGRATALRDPPRDGGLVGEVLVPPGGVADQRRQRGDIGRGRGETALVSRTRDKAAGPAPATWILEAP